jgi:hypothetical protein
MLRSMGVPSGFGSAGTGEANVGRGAGVVKACGAQVQTPLPLDIAATAAKATRYAIST